MVELKHKPQVAMAQLAHHQVPIQRTWVRVPALAPYDIKIILPNKEQVEKITWHE